MHSRISIEGCAQEPRSQMEQGIEETIKAPNYWRLGFLKLGFLVFQVQIRGRLPLGFGLAAHHHTVLLSSA